MISSMALRASLRSVMTLVMAGILLLCASQGVAEGRGESSSSASVGESGPVGVPITVSVEFSTAIGGSSGGGVVSSTVEATVLPVSGYLKGASGAQMAANLHNNQFMAEVGRWSKMSTEEIRAEYPNYLAYKDDHDGFWYSPFCWQTRAPEMDQGSFNQMANAYDDANEDVYVPAGSEPPVPVVDGRTLAQAAWDAVVIPNPEVGYNPSLGESGYTLVGWYTWVWASGGTPTQVTATATAGPVSATVTAVADGLDLSGPDTEVDCAGFGVPWSPGASGTDCTVVFTRSSAHLGGSTPLSVSASYAVSFTATDGASGDLGSATTTSTVDIPVAEVQTLNTNEH